MFTYATLLVSAALHVPYIAPTSFTCYASKDRATEKVLVITDTPKPALNSRGLRRIACPENMTWSIDDAKRQCNFLRHYGFESAVEYIALNGISPEEVCQEGRRAAGLPETVEKPETIKKVEN